MIKKYKEKIKMEIIRLGRVSIYLIYPFLIPISRIKKNKAHQIVEGKPVNDYFIISTCLMFLAESLGGCLYFLKSCQFTPSNSQKLIRKRKRKIQIQVIQSSFVKYSFLTVLCVLGFSVIDLIGSVAFSGFGTPSFHYMMKTIQIFLYSRIFWKIFHIKLYSHQYLSLTLIIIGVVLVNVFFDFASITLYWIFLIIISQLLYAIKYSGGKWIMINKCFNPMLMLLIEGLFGFGLCLIILFGLYIFCPSNSTNTTCTDLGYFNNFGLNDGYIIVIYIIFSGVLNVCIFQTNYYFMPTLLAISNVLSSFVDWTVTSITNKKLDIWSFVGYFIIIIGSLVYNEIIILDFWNLGYNTKSLIQERSLKETNICDMELNNEVNDLNEEEETNVTMKLIETE